MKTIKVLVSLVMVAVLLTSWSADALAAGKTLSAPKASLASGTFNGTQTIKLSGPSGATIRYTTNGRSPTASSTKYSKPLTISKKTTIKAIAVRKGYANSKVFTATYDIRPITLKAPKSLVKSGTYSGTQIIKLTGPLGATIRYTTNGRTPTVSSTKYSNPIKVTKNTMIKAIAVRSGYKNSPVMSVSISIKTPAPSTAYIPASKSFPLGGGSVLIKAPSGTTIYLILKGIVVDDRKPTTKDYDYKVKPGCKVNVQVVTDTEVQLLLVRNGYVNNLISRSFVIRTDKVEPMGDEFCAAVLEGVNWDRWNAYLTMPDGSIITNVAPAVMDEKLSAIAQEHAMKLAAEDRLYHTGLNYDESVAGPLAEDAFSVGIHSGGHCPALCAPEDTRIGVGAARALTGKYYVVVMGETEEQAAQN